MRARIEIEGSDEVTEVAYHRKGEEATQSACFTDPLMALLFRQSILSRHEMDLVSLRTLGSREAETLYRNPDTGEWSDKDERLPF